MIAAVSLVGCGKEKPVRQPPKVVSEKLIADSTVEKAIREELKKPEGKLSEEDLLKVTNISLGFAQINNDSLKDIAKLKKLRSLDLSHFNINAYFPNHIINIGRLRPDINQKDCWPMENVRVEKYENNTLIAITRANRGLIKYQAEKKSFEFRLFEAQMNVRAENQPPIPGNSSAKPDQNETSAEWQPIAAAEIILTIGLEQLSQQALTDLGLINTQITKAGLAELQKALPKCEIYSNPTK